MTLKIDFEIQILALFDIYCWPFNKFHEKINTIFQLVQSWLQSEIFLSNSVEVMKNLSLLKVSYIILKANCQALNSSKKRTNEFVFTTMRCVLVPFLEEIEDTRKTFQNCLTIILLLFCNYFMCNSLYHLV